MNKIKMKNIKSQRKFNAGPVKNISVTIKLLTLIVNILLVGIVYGNF